MNGQLVFSSPQNVFLNTNTSPIKKCLENVSLKIDLMAGVVAQLVA